MMLRLQKETITTKNVIFNIFLITTSTDFFYVTTDDEGMDFTEGKAELSFPIKNDS